MKKLIFLLLFVFGTAFAQLQTPNYDKYSVTVSAGTDVLRGPVAAKFNGGVAVGYKFAENYAKFFDTAYGTFGYNNATMTPFHVGLQRTMMNDRDRAGLILKVEGGGTALYGQHVVLKPSAAAGVGVGFDFSGEPYPAWMNHTVLSLVPMFNKVASRPFYVTFALGFTKTFK
jgi:hypothetical protein